MTYSLEKGSSRLTSDMVQAVDVGLRGLVQLVEGPGTLPGEVLVCADTAPMSLYFWYMFKTFTEMGN